MKKIGYLIGFIAGYLIGMLIFRDVGNPVIILAFAFGLYVDRIEIIKQKDK